MKTALILLLAFGTYPYWCEPAGLFLDLGTNLLIWALFALGFNLLLGYTGLVSFAHGAFFGIGGYAAGLAQKNLGFASDNLFACIAVAAAAAAFAGAVTGIFISHRRGVYYALMSLAFGEMFHFIAMRWTSVTNGEDGLLDLQPTKLFSSPLAYYYLCFAIVAALGFLLYNLTHSPLGMILQAIRQNELRAQFAGYAVWRYKLLSLTISAGIAGLAGGLAALNRGGAFPDVMSLHDSGNVLIATVLGGGLVNFFGPIFGSILFVVPADLLRAHTQTWHLWFGLMFMVVVMLRCRKLDLGTRRP